MVPVLISGTLLAAYNYAMFGNPTGSYGNGFNEPLLFSPARGLLIYFPIATFFDRRCISRCSNEEYLHPSLGVRAFEPYPGRQMDRMVWRMVLRSAAANRNTACPVATHYPSLGRDYLK